MLTPAEIDRRMPVWHALADLFLDTEPRPFDYAHLERMRLEAGFTQDELHAILADEVYPAFCWNLRQVAGEWAMWTEQEVRRTCTMVVNRPRWLRWLNARPDRQTIESMWSDYLKYLADSKPW